MSPAGGLAKHLTGQLAAEREQLTREAVSLHAGRREREVETYLREWLPWRYPLPLYLEIPSLPLYAVGAVCGFSALGARALAALRRSSAAVRARWSRRRTFRRLSPAVIPAAALLTLGVMVRDVPTIWKLIVAEPLTALSTIDHLRFLPEGFLERMRREITLHPGAPFRGRMVSVVGVASGGASEAVQSMRKTPFNKWYWNDINDQLAHLAPADFSATPWTTGLPTVAETEREQRQRAEASEQRAQQLLYAANLNLIQQAWGADNIGLIQRLLTETKDSPHRVFEWYYLWRLCHSELLNLAGHVAPIRSIAFSPDGSMLASAGHELLIRLWDADSGQPRQSLEGHTSWISSLAFSPDGRTLVSGSADKTVRLWDAAQAKARTTLQGFASDVTCLAFSPDGRLLAAASGVMGTRIGTMSKKLPMLVRLE